MPKRVECQIARDAEEEGLGRVDRVPRPRLPNSQVGLLHHIVNIPHRWKPAPQEGPQGRPVRLHLFGKPLFGTLWFIGRDIHGDDTRLYPQTR